MNVTFTPVPFGLLLRPVVFLTLFLAGVSLDLGAQCDNIDLAGFSPADTAHCGAPLTIGFQSAVSVDSTPVFLTAKTSPPDFKSNFSFSFPTENNGCYYFLEIEGYFTLWSDTDDFFDAFGKFDISTNELISQGVTNKLAITTPLFILPGAFSTAHVYRYYYQGDGGAITVSFNDDLLPDNSGSMTFSWHVVPCFSTFWDLGDGATSTETDVLHSYTSPGAYPVTLTVTSELDGCSETASGLVTVYPEAATSLSATICKGDTYWLGNNAFSETGTWSEVFDSWLGCDSTVTLDLLVLDPSASILPPAAIDCNNATVTLDGSGSSSGPGVSFLWTGPGPGCIAGDASQPTITAGCPGTYSLQVMATADGTQCTATAEVTVTAIPVMDLSWEAIGPDCLNPAGTIAISVVSGGKPPFLYSIDGGDHFQQGSAFDGLDAGQYEIVVQDAAGCETEPEPVFLASLVPISVEAGTEVTIQAGGSWPLEVSVNLPADQIDSIRWTPAESLSCADCLDPVASPASTTEYLVEIWDINGCYASATFRVVVDIFAVYVPNAFSPNGDGINDEFMIFGRQGSVAKVRSFMVFSKWGQLIFQRSDFPPNDPKFGWDGFCRGRQMDPGVYGWFAEVEFADGALEIFKGGVTLVR